MPGEVPLSKSISIGSVNGSNCEALIRQGNIDGFLVGGNYFCRGRKGLVRGFKKKLPFAGASLKPEFEQICRSRSN